MSETIDYTPNEVTERLRGVAFGRIAVLEAVWCGRATCQESAVRERDDREPALEMRAWLAHHGWRARPGVGWVCSECAAGAEAGV